MIETAGNEIIVGEGHSGRVIIFSGNFKARNGFNALERVGLHTTISKIHPFLANLALFSVF